MTAYEALVRTGAEALREGGSGLNTTYDEDAAMVLAAVLPHLADLLAENHTGQARLQSMTRYLRRLAPAEPAAVSS